MRLTDDDSKPRVDVRLLDVTSDYEEDQALKEALDKFSSIFFFPCLVIFYFELIVNLLQNKGVIGEKMEEVLGTFSVPLDGLFASIRTSETNLGNFICDIMARFPFFYFRKEFCNC